MNTKLKLKTAAGIEHGVDTARNLRQAQNIKHYQDNKDRLGHDELYNLIQLHYHLPDFVWSLNVVPDMSCVLAADGLLDDLHKALQV